MAKNAIMAKLLIDELLKFAADSEYFSFRVTKGLNKSPHFVQEISETVLNS